MIKGNIYIISAPSGAGKSSLINALIEKKIINNIKVSISYTTRAIRPGEINGIHYFFVSKKKFQNLISDYFFLEYAYVFGNYYGTSYQSIINIISTGTDIILNIDWKGARQIRKYINNTRSIYILPPSKKVLYCRLNKREQDNDDVISARMKQAVKEMTHYLEYDYIIINSDFDTALFDLKTIIHAERLNVKLQMLRYNKLIEQLINS